MQAIAASVPGVSSGAGIAAVATAGYTGGVVKIWSLDNSSAKPAGTTPASDLRF